MADTFVSIEPRPAPVNTEGLVPWVKHNLFGDLRSTVVTVLLAAFFLYWLPPLFDWLLFKAVFAPKTDECQAARGVGACWGVITEKYRLIIFGRYPFEQQWRPQVATILLVALLVASCIRTFWKPWLVLLWLAVLAIFFTLMGGGVMGLEKVPTDRC